MSAARFGCVDGRGALITESLDNYIDIESSRVANCRVTRWRVLTAGLKSAI